MQRNIEIAIGSPPGDWDQYVLAHPEACAYHGSNWAMSVATVFRQPAYFLACRAADRKMIGLLPLIRQNSLLFGNRLTSLPYFNYGGALADSDDAQVALLDAAKRLAAESGTDRLEIRSVARPPVEWPARTDKATLVLDLPSSMDALGKQLGSKLRSQVKRAQRENVAVRTGGMELVPDFYRVFSEVMRDLGTPVYPRRFFEAIVRDCKDHCTLLVLYLESAPVSCAFLVGHRGQLEIPWAATIAAVKPKSINMALYWAVLRYAVENGYTAFDFGRSTIDSGPYRFKLQWGARPIQLNWAVWTPLPESANSTSTGENGKLRGVLTSTWSRLPLWCANRLGPLVSPSLPW